MPRSHRLLLLAGCAAVASCGPFPWDDPAPAVVTEEHLGALAGEVWAVLPRVYEIVGLPAPSFYDAASYSLSSSYDVLVRNSTVGPDDAPVARCAVQPRIEKNDSDPGGARTPGAPALRTDRSRVRVVRAEYHGWIRLTVATSVEEASGASRLRTELVATPVGPVDSGDGVDWAVQCITTGRLEERIVEAVRGVTEPDYPVSDQDALDGAPSPF